MALFRKAPRASVVPASGNGSGDARAVLAEAEFMQERLAQLELALEDEGWIRLGFEGELQFSRQGLAEIVKLSRLMYRKNPLVNRGVNVQVLYVWGQGVSVSCSDEDANASITEFLQEKGNAKTLFGQQARGLAEIELATTGNLFVVGFLPGASAGPLQLRTIPVEEILAGDIISNPEDKLEVWYYKRVWQQAALDPVSGVVSGVQKTAYYPDWDYDPAGDDHLETIGGNAVLWDSPIYHVKVGGMSVDSFGVPEVYQALDWAKEHAENLQDWAAITRAYRRFAWKDRVTGGPKAIAAAKAKLQTGVGTSTGETNPAPLTGATLLEGQGHDFQPLKTAGATTSPADSRYLLLQVAAAMGLPETFFGDASVGSLATAKSLDKPSELKFSERRELWKQIWLALITRALSEANVAVPEDAAIDVDFPPILEHDIEGYINALVRGVTLDGKQSVLVPDLRELARMVLTRLGEDDIDSKLEAMFPKGEQGQSAEVPPAEAAFVKALGDLQAFLEARVSDA